MSDRVVLGVDGGNTKTVAAVLCLDGTVAGTARGGPSDLDVTGPRAVDVIVAVTTEAMADAGVEQHQVDARCSASPVPTGPRTASSSSRASQKGSSSAAGPR